MGIKFVPTELPGVILIEPEIFEDRRGCFLEIYHEEKYSKNGIPTVFVQDNFSISTRNVLRGLHYQTKNPQAKLVMALRGEIYDVAVDIRPDSPTFGKWLGVYLSGENKRQIFVPEGFAHGFCVVSEFADVHYKCSVPYDPNGESGFLWSDRSLSIDWPIDNPVLSPKDSKLPSFRDAFRGSTAS